MRALIPLLVLLAGCPGAKDAVGPDTDLVDTAGDDTAAPPQDADRDGFDVNEDCDDAQPTVFPGASELCDGLDNNCDGVVDEGATTTEYQDVDGDGYGDEGVSIQTCSPGDWGTVVAGDCDDLDPFNHPGAEEICDGVDNDCDGEADEAGATGESTWYADDDGDGYGDPAVATVSCDAPDAAIADSSDCDDADAAIHPDAEEICDGVDNDCDAVTDSDATDATTWYLDSDHDYYGDESSPLVACDKPAGYRPRARDCDDSDANVYPGAPELCDNQTNDCDSAGWSTDDEAGRVALEDESGAWSDFTAEFDGRVDLSAGTLWICAGTYTVDLRADAVDVTLVGPAGATETILEADGGAVLTATNGAVVSASGLALTGGTVRGTDTPRGGAIYAKNADLSLTGVLVAGNAATRGGGIYFNGGTLNLFASVVGGNTAVAGGGLYVASGDVTCTGAVGAELGIEANVAASGAGVYQIGGTFTSNACDFGDGTYDNLLLDGSVQDLWMKSAAFNYGYDESFTCDASAGTCD